MIAPTLGTGIATSLTPRKLALGLLVMLQRSNCLRTLAGACGWWVDEMIGLMLSFVVCVSAAGDGRCQQVELPFEGSLLQCMLYGQHQAARWTSDHPGWHVARGWRCLSGKPI